MWYPKRNPMKQREPYAVPCCTSSDFLVSEFREEHPIEHFLFQENKAPHDDKQSYRRTSDIFMLFNQQRLDRLSKDKLLEYFSTIPQSDTRMSALRSKLSDEQLCSFVKSRFIQSRSELLSWSQYLMSSQDALLVAAAAEREASESLDAVPGSDPVPTE